MRITIFSLILATFSIYGYSFLQTWPVFPALKPLISNANGFSLQSAHKSFKEGQLDSCLKMSHNNEKNVVNINKAKKLSYIQRSAQVLGVLGLGILGPKLDFGHSKSCSCGQCPGTLFRNDIARADSAEDQYIDSLVTMMLAKDIIEPTNVAVDTQAYDRARTNIKYILNQLQFQKKVEYLIKSSIDYCDDLDAIDAATEASGRIGNMLLQYDGSIYTCVFIPSEDGDIPPSAKKYRKEAINYYNNILSDLNVLLKLGTEGQVSKAQAIATAKKTDLPKVLFFTAESLRRTGI